MGLNQKYEGLQEEIAEMFNVQIQGIYTEVDLESTLDLGSDSSQVEQLYRLSELPRHRVLSECQKCRVPSDECVEIPTTCPIIRGLPTNSTIQ